MLGILHNAMRDDGVFDVVGRGGCRVEHTFVRRGYAARLDRIYVTQGIGVERVQSFDVGFSDHREVMADLVWDDMVRIYPGYWKLKVRFLRGRGRFLGIGGIFSGRLGPKM